MFENVYFKTNKSLARANQIEGTEPSPQKFPEHARLAVAARACSALRPSVCPRNDARCIYAHAYVKI